ncbi:hypothetical protein GCM10009000_085560 [Halobacterium noricense]|uniref:Uncharacterized protein n=1 Tax=Haladaptatus pallidirubidus TaxID=1008152 RepID=A0AAV3URU7_9EURY
MGAEIELTVEIDYQDDKDKQNLYRVSLYQPLRIPRSRLIQNGPPPVPPEDIIPLDHRGPICSGVTSQRDHQGARVEPGIEARRGK